MRGQACGHTAGEVPAGAGHGFLRAKCHSPYSRQRSIELPRIGLLRRVSRHREKEVPLGTLPGGRIHRAGCERDGLAPGIFDAAQEQPIRILHQEPPMELSVGVVARRLGRRAVSCHQTAVQDRVELEVATSFQQHILGNEIAPHPISKPSAIPQRVRASADPATIRPAEWQATVDAYAIATIPGQTRLRQITSELQKEWDNRSPIRGCAGVQSAQVQDECCRRG